MTAPRSQLNAEPTSAASVRTLRIAQPTRLPPDVMASTDAIANEAGALRQSTGMLSQDAAQLHGDSLRIQLRARTDEAAKRAPAELLSELGALGFSWTAVARVLGVSIPAVRKWRGGATVSGCNRRKIAEFVALAGVLERDHMIADVASWLDVPLAESSFTGIDVLEAGHLHDLIEYGAQHIGSTDLLDRSLPRWRDSLDDRFEVYTAGDGEMAIRLRQDRAMLNRNDVGAE